MKKSAQSIKYRTAGLLVVLMSMVLWSDERVLIGYSVVLCLFMWWSGLSLREAGQRLLLLIPFGAGTLAFLPFHGHEVVVGDVMGWHVYEDGLTKAIGLLLKMVNASLILSMMLHKIDSGQFFHSLRALGLPKLLTELLQLMMRYVHVLGEEARSMVLAQKARGFRAQGWWWSINNYRRFGQLMGVLFVRSLRRSERVDLAMRSRGEREWFGGTDMETSMEKSLSGRSEWAVEMKGVGYSYAGSNSLALRGIDLSIRSGSKTVLMGMNGAGKSTLISLLNGLAQVSKGMYRLFGQEITEKNAMHARRGVGVVYQDPDDQLFSPTVSEDIAYGPSNMGLSESEIEDRVTYAIGAVGLSALADKSPFELSYGQKRRVAIAGVMAMRPPMMVLDEPMAYLDPRGRDELQALLEQLHLMGTTLIVATHDVDFAAEWADHVIILRDGKVLAEGDVSLLFDEKIVYEAGLHLPRLVRPFRLLQGAGDVKPRTVRQAAQEMWRLILKGTNAETKHDEQNQLKSFR